MNSDGGDVLEIKTTLGTANKCYFSLKKHLCVKLLSCKIKCLIYKTLIRPVLKFGSETWTVGKHGENILDPLRESYTENTWPGTCKWKLEEVQKL